MNSWVAGTLLLFLVAYGHRMRADVYNVAHRALADHSIRERALWRRVLLFLSVPLDGAACFFISFLPRPTREELFAFMVTDEITLAAIRSGIAWSEARKAALRAAEEVLGTRIHYYADEIVYSARRRFNRKKR